MNVLFIILTVVILLAAILLIIVVLLQSGKAFTGRDLFQTRFSDLC